jgi:hypothetical protein
MNKQDIPVLRNAITNALTRLDTCHPRDVDLLVFSYRDHPLDAACGLDELAWSLTSGLHTVVRNDVRGFFELLLQALDRLEATDAP